LPIFYVISFFYLFGNLNDLTNDDDQDSKDKSWMYLWIGIGFMAFGAVIGILIFKFTSKSEAP
jgi:amino acid permease